MTILASKSAQAFYDDAINTVIPDDAVEISPECHMALLVGESSGSRIIKWDAGDLPVLADRPPPTEAELAASERSWRDAQLVAADPLVTRHRDERDVGGATTLTGNQYSELLSYRQGLRDWPQSELFPDVSERPLAPPWLAEHTQ
ncbi:phage tail assembly chaperone [Pseudomonas sp.]|uniref:phage tail assembly chaperone n=1 Tax=Pseudomonas sp. TaxID=306 RepID=UPI003C758B83